MFVVYDHNSGMFQFSCARLCDAGVVRGVHVHDSHSRFFQKNFFLLSSEKTSSWKYPDLRIKMKNVFLKRIVFLLFWFVFFILNIYDIFSQKIKFTFKFFSIFFVLLFSVFLVFQFFVCEKFVYQEDKTQKPEISLQEWKELFKKSSFSKNVATKKHSFFKDEIPILKGIKDFRVIPLHGQEIENEKTQNLFSGYLFLPYPEIFVLTKENFSYLKKPVLTCEKEKSNFFIFKVREEDEIVLMKNDGFELHKKLNFIIFSEKEFSQFLKSKKSNFLCENFNLD